MWLSIRRTDQIVNRFVKYLASAPILSQVFVWDTFGVCSPAEMISDKERKSDDGDQLQGSPFSTRYHAHERALVCRLSLELPACRRADGGARGAGRGSHRGV